MPPKQQKQLQNQNFKIASYIRVSTEEQAENPEGSIRNQEERIKDAVQYRNRNGHYGEIVQTFVDPGISAKDMKRPALQAMLKTIRSGEVNLVVVTELSRLSRNTRDFIQIWDLMRDVLNKVREFHEANPVRKEECRLKAKVFGINSQIDGLAVRLSELPKGISAAPIYKQMLKLEELSGQYKSELEKLKTNTQGSFERVVNLQDFEAFTKRYKKLTFDDLTVDQKKQLLKRFIHKIEIGVDSVKIHFIVDGDRYKEESALADAASCRNSDFFKICGSNTLTVGARDWT